MNRLLEEYARRFANGRDLADDDAELLLDAMTAEAEDGPLTSLFRAWNEKGIAAGEIYSFARILRHRCKKVRTRHEIFADIVGTGGGRSKSFNVSTAAAFVAAGAGLPVAKHGNRAATSRSGSADVLEALGVDPAVDGETAERCLDEVGICFMFAPKFHRLSPTLSRVRRGLGFPTIFNCIGPLCNPAEAPVQLIGVWSRELITPMAEALAELGTERAWVVHAEIGLDEIAVTGANFIAEISGRTISEFELRAADLGLSETASPNAGAAGSAEESAALIRRVLNGLNGDAQAKNTILANAAAALFLAGTARGLREGVELASESISDGRAARKLADLAAAVKR